MKKYLLIVKNGNTISYEVFKVRTSLTSTEMTLISKHYTNNSVCEWHCIDNMELEQVGEILLTLTKFLKGYKNGK